MTNKKQSEVRLVTEALTRLGLSARSVCPCDPPFADVFVTLEDGGIIGVEVTDYYSDAAGGAGSPNRAFASNWLRVQTEIRCQVERHPHLRHIRGQVKPQHKLTLPSGLDAQALASELVGFAAETLREGCTAGPTTRRQPFAQQCPLMNKYVAELTLTSTGAASWLPWYCTGVASGFGLVADSLTASIRKKEQKKYKWGGVEERWLLITGGAAPSTVASWVGPESQTAGRLKSLDLSWITGFDRVLFLESSFSWAREIWRKAGLPALPSGTKGKARSS